MKLNLYSIKNDKSEWQKAGFILPSYDADAIKRKDTSPEWIHFGAGNIFKAYIARIADDLISAGELSTGIIAVDLFHEEPIEKAFRPFDDLILLAGLPCDGSEYMRVLGSVGSAVAATGTGLFYLKQCLRSASVKLVSFTITEKGYATKDASGCILPDILHDIIQGPCGDLKTGLGKTALLLFERFKAGAAPIALLSLDNCSNNGDMLREGILMITNGWKRNGLTDDRFLSYVSDRAIVSFPCSMIDKITPAPCRKVADRLSALGVEGMEPAVTSRGSFIAPFANAEMSGLLVIEDAFPNGRPAFEKAGVYMADRPTVKKAERMKVSACLNPLHTALAIFGCLLGFDRISDEMNDPDLRELVYRLGYNEGLPAVSDPGIIKPEDFLCEVINERLPNPNLPDTPQRIATDTSKKLSVRFGETIKTGGTGLVIIPFVIAGWLRYLTGTDDLGHPMRLSPDPILSQLACTFRPEMFGRVFLSTGEKEAVKALLKNSDLFGADLVSAGLYERITGFFTDMLAGKGAVRKTLQKVLLYAAETYDKKEDMT
ncbi:MAG: mannitol dehydrogenase family protein [Lachnospiraceae bacterium]|nr:mannitol dehydrogenase family protein [Lachnospiraceae bacterium]